MSRKRKVKKVTDTLPQPTKAVDKVVLDTKGTPVLEIPVTKVADKTDIKPVETPVEVVEETTPSDVESQGDKKGNFAKNDPSSNKTVVEETPKKEDSTKERENEKESTAPSSGSESEDTSTAEDSKPTDAPTKDTSTPTTTKVEPKVEEEKSYRKPSSKVPHWLLSYYDKGWIRPHGTIPNPRDGYGIEVHACNEIDEKGHPVAMTAKKVKQPRKSAFMTQEYRDNLQKLYDAEVQVEFEKLMSRRESVYVKIDRMLKSFLSIHLKTVHCWNKKADKALNITGVAVGLMGGHSPYVVKIMIDTPDGPKLIRRNFKNITTTLPAGIEASPVTPLRNVVDVEKEVDRKLLENKSTDIILPTGFDEVRKNNLSDKRFHTILVWNSGGVQLSFFASPVEGQKNEFKWVSLDMSESGYIGIHNDAIRMSGSIQGLIRVTAKVNQDHIDDLLLVSIPEDDNAQLSAFMEVLRMGAIERTIDAKENREEIK